MKTGIKKYIFLIVFALLAVSALSQTVTTKFRCYLLNPGTDLNKTDVLTIGELKIGTIPADTDVQVIGLDTIKYIFYKVKHRNKIGYIHRDVVVNKSLILSLDPEIREAYRLYAKRGMIAIGMNMYEVTATLGTPQDINRTVTVDSQNEQWCYTTANKNKYVYFESGIVTAFQD